MRKLINLYILECADKTYYVGVSTDMEGRLRKHQTGYYKTCYTYSRRPVKLVYCTQYEDYLLAFDWEHRIKNWSHAKKEALIKGDFELLKQLSRKKFKKT